MDRIDLATWSPAVLRARRLRGIRSSWQRRRALERARRIADAELLASEFTSPRTAWRATELTATKNRLALARSIRKLVRSAEARYLPGPTPLNRIGVRQETERLLALADALVDVEQPVAARGVLLLDGLLTDGYGPVYISYRAAELPVLLDRAAKALEVRR